MARPSGRRGVSQDFPTPAHGNGTAPGGSTGTWDAVREQPPQPAHGRARGARRPAGPAGAPAPRSGWRGLVDYPRHGRTGFTRWIPSWRLVGTGILLGIGTVVLAFLVAYVATPIPDGRVSAKYQTSTVYFRDGSVLGRFQQENRTLVTNEQVPLYLRHAVIAAEDRSFETNSGVSVTGMVRALANNAQGGGLQGGSTITQQYVKNYYLTAERTYTRKVKEVFIALKLGRSKSKDDVMTGYLNTIYWGRGANGVEAAARLWFGKTLDPAVIQKDPSKRLTKSEAAFLAGIINGPGFYDPSDEEDGKENLARAKQRWQFVVDGMVTEGYLTADEASKLKFPKVLKNVPSNIPRGYRGYLLEMVRKEAEANGFNRAELDTKGLEISTTFDAKLMAQAEKSVQEAMPPRKEWPKGTQVALSSIDVKTGEIRAIYGGRDYLQRQRNAATQDTMQAGSTFKPFTLLAALQGRRDAPEQCRPIVTDEAISLDSRFDGASPQTFGTFPVRNFGGRSFGWMDLRRATANSVNTVYVALNEKVGEDQTAAAAVCAGIPKGTSDLKPVLSNVLGSASPHPIDMAFAYATIANKGERTRLHGIRKIQAAQNGKVLYQYRPQDRQVFDEQVAANAIDAMQQVVRRGSGTFARQLDRPVAGKTGTSSDNYSAWFVGFTPQISTSVAMYRIGPDGGQLPLEGFGGFGEITGGSLPVRVWTNYMTAALDGVPVEDFPPAQDIGQVVNPEPEPEPEPTEQPTEQPTQPQPTQPQPTEQPTLPPTPTLTQTPTDSPSPTDTGPPDPSPTPSDSPGATGRPRPTVTIPP